MDSSKLSDEFLDKAINSIQDCVQFISNPNIKLNDKDGLIIREAVHSYELLMKAHISKYHPLLLVDADSKALVKGSEWTSQSFDSFKTKNLVELPKLLFYLSDGKLDFIKTEISKIEELRTLRNKVEHSHLEVDKKFIELELVPFFYSVLFKLIESLDEVLLKEVLSKSEMTSLLNSYKGKSKLDILKRSKPSLKFYKVPVLCEECETRNSFLTNDADLLYCLHCNEEDDSREVISCPKCTKRSFVNETYVYSCKNCKLEKTIEECPICTELSLFKTETFASCQSDSCSESRYVFSLEDEDISDNQKKCDVDCPKCFCSSGISLYEETGEEDGYCFKCQNRFNMWKCKYCSTWKINEEKCDPPENVQGDNVCGDCISNVKSAYQVPDD